MSSNILVIICLFLILHAIEITKCELKDRIQTIESNDVDSLPDIFSSFIEKIKLLIHQSRCPEGWKLLGGSCYYFSNFTSTSSLVNRTCHHLHSNSSSLMKIQNGIEFLYAAHVLARNNLASLMIEIDSHLLRGKSLTDMLLNDRNKWSQIRKKMVDQRNRFQNEARIIINELKRNGFNVARRSKKSNLNETMTVTTAIIRGNQYEYDELNLPNDIDEFEQMETMHNICDDLHWNTYILDYCIANILCGKYGRCESTLKGFKCTCSFLFGGVFCDNITREGLEILVGIAFTVLFGGPVGWLLSLITTKRSESICSRLKSFDLLGNASKFCCGILKAIYKKIHQLCKRKNEGQSEAATSTEKFEFIRMILIMIFTTIILALILITIVVKYMIRFQIDMNGEILLKNASHSIIYLVKECKHYTRNEVIYLLMAFVSLVLVIFFSLFGSRDKINCGVLPPMEPFRTTNRGIITLTFGSLAYEVLKSFEGLIFNLSDQLSQGVLTELCLKVGMIAIMSLLYYPILLSLHFKNLYVRCTISSYMILFIGLTIVREGSCIGYLPLSNEKAILEESKLRLELGTWFLIYGLIKNLPQFIFLSYITAELFVRCLFDTIYMTIIKKQGAIIDNSEQAFDMKCALVHVKRFLVQRKRIKDRTCVRKLCDSIYEWNDEFCFSTMILSTFTVAGIFLYYLVCSFVFLFISRTTGHITFLKSYLKSRINKDEFEEVSLQTEIICSAVLTGVFYAIQLLFGLKQFREDKKKLYRPARKKNKLSYRKIASEAVHFPGLLIINIAWGFVITFHLILLLAIALRMIYSQVPDAAIALNILVPAIIIYTSRKVLMSILEKFIFHEEKKENNTQDKYPSPISYAIFAYLCFFADCFLGITSCLIRLIRATILNFLFIARLDWNFLSRPLERCDGANNAYRSYLQIEVYHSHPVKLAFTYLCLKAINKRPRLYYDDDCCIVTDQSAQDGINLQENETTYQNRRERARPNDKIADMSIRLHKNESSSPLLPYKNQPRKRIEQNKTNSKKVRIQENKMPTSASRGSVKMIKQNNNKSDDESDDDGGIKVKSRSKTSKTNVQPKPIVKPPTTGQTDEEDEDGGVSTKKITKQRNKAGEKQKQKQDSEEKKKKQSLRDQSFDDEDGAVSKPKSKPQKSKTKNHSSFSRCFLGAEEGEDEDNAIKKPKPPPSSTTEKKKPKTEAKKKEVESSEDEDGAITKPKPSPSSTSEKKKTKTEVKKKEVELSDDEDGGAKQDKPIKKKISNKPNIEIQPEDDEDEDGGRKVKTYDAIKKIIPPKQPILNKPIVKNDTPMKTKKDKKPSAVPVTVDKSSNETISTQKDNATEVKTSKPRTISRKSFSNKIYCRTNSYTSAQENSISTMSLTDSNSDDAYYDEIPDNQNESLTTNPVPSMNREVESTVDQMESMSDKNKEARKKRIRTLWYFAYVLINSSLLNHSDDEESEDNVFEETIPPTNLSTTIEISQDTTQSQSHTDSLIPVTLQELNQDQRQQQHTIFHSVHIEQISTAEVLQQDSITYIQTTHNRQTEECIVNK